MANMKKGDESRGLERDDPLFKATQIKPQSQASGLKNPRLPRGMTRHILQVEPATSFEYRYESSAGTARVIHLERGAVESRSGNAQPVQSFRATVSPGEKPTRGGFFTSPDSIAMSAEAIILIEGIATRDVFVSRSFGSFDGLRVTVTVFRQNSDGSFERIIREDISDADEHRFLIP